VRQGDAAVANLLDRQRDTVWVADAVEPVDLEVLAKALVQTDAVVLPCGSGGLAGPWCRAVAGAGQAVRPTWPADDRPVLVVAGSRNEATARQLRRADESGVLKLLLLPADRTGGATLTGEAIQVLGSGQNVALTSTFGDLWPDEIESVASSMGELTRAVLASTDVAGLVLTGGDIARAVSRSLGAAALRVIGEVQPGVVKGALVGGRCDGMRVVTKAGGFGDDDAIVQSLRGLRGRTE
jgi:uncharacterized protein YgbK (DUF1537 family)